jgi:hypothetical protein
MKEFELTEGMKLEPEDEIELSVSDKQEIVLFERWLALMSLRGYYDQSLSFVQRAQIMRDAYESVYGREMPTHPMGPADSGTIVRSNNEQAFVDFVGDKINGR